MGIRLTTLHFAIDTITLATTSRNTTNSTNWNFGQNSKIFSPVNPSSFPATRSALLLKVTITLITADFIFQSHQVNNLHFIFSSYFFPVRSDQTCSSNAENRPVCVWPYNEDQSVLMKAWNIESQDKLTPFSNYADSFDDENGVGILKFRNQCAARCRDTPGCFKFMIDGASTCLLRGNNIENRNQDTYGRNSFCEQIKFSTNERSN